MICYEAIVPNLDGKVKDDFYGSFAYLFVGDHVLFLCLGITPGRAWGITHSTRNQAQVGYMQVGHMQVNTHYNISPKDYFDSQRWLLS